MTRITAFLLALILAGCSGESPTSPRGDAPEAYGATLVPAGHVLWDTGWIQGKVGWDSTRLKLTPVASFWVDTGWSGRSGTTFLDGVRAANKRSREVGLDTVYTVVGTKVVVRDVDGFRFPTPLEARYLVWEGATTIYPWGTDPTKGEEWAMQFTVGGQPGRWVRWQRRSPGLDAFSGMEECPTVGVSATVGGITTPWKEHMCEASARSLVLVRSLQ